MGVSRPQIRRGGRSGYSSLYWHWRAPWASAEDASVSLLPNPGARRAPRGRRQLVPYEGGEVQPEGVVTQPALSTSAVSERWAFLNRCTGAPEEQTEARDRPTNGALDATHLMWTFFDSLPPAG